MNIIREEGAVFTQASVAGPKCAPSRFNTLTGRYCSRGEQSKTDTTFAATEGGDTRSTVDVPTCKLIGADLKNNLQTDLTASGYATIMAGKWHLSATAKYVGAPRGPLHEGRSTRATPRGSLHGGAQFFF